MHLKCIFLCVLGPIQSDFSHMITSLHPMLCRLPHWMFEYGKFESISHNRLKWRTLNYIVTMVPVKGWDIPNKIGATKDNYFSELASGSCGLGLSIDTNFMIWFNFDSQACELNRLRYRLIGVCLWYSTWKIFSRKKISVN